MNKATVRGVCVVLAAVGLAAAGASGQGTQPTTSRPVRGLPVAPKPVVPPPGTAGAPAAAGTPAVAVAPREAAKVGAYVKQEQPRDLTLTAVVRIHLDSNAQKTTYRDPFSGTMVSMPNVTPMKFNTLGFVFPLVMSTSSMDLFVDDYKGLLRINGQPGPTTAKILNGYPGGAKLARWDAGTVDTVTEARQVELDLEESMRCYNTVFDEDAANAVAWPKGAWPADAASALTAQLYVETGVDGTGHIRPYDDKALTEALKGWLAEEGITDWKQMPPVRAAKTIAGKVWEIVQVTGDGITFLRTGEMSGMEIMPPSDTLTTKRGTEQDVTALMAALYKKAGLPTRTVIGYDVGGKNGKFLQKGNKRNELRSYVEFALYDESKNTINWVPVDVPRMRRTTNRPPAIDRAWKYFGTNDELNSVTPFALHFHPPTDVVAYGSAGFWGWFVTPKAAAGAEQAIRFVATTSSKKGGEPPVDPKNPEQRKEEKKKRGY